MYTYSNISRDSPYVGDMFPDYTKFWIYHIESKIREDQGLQCGNV